MLMPRFSGVYTSSDSDVYDELARLVREAHVGGVIGFGGEEPVPQVLLNPTYGPIILGQPLALASMFNRLQTLAAVPLLTAADFEWGVGMRIAGATKLPRAMAFGAADDEQLAIEAGRVTAVEGRALGVHVNFAPVADVNNNPRNPVINIRSFGEDPARVGALTSAWVERFAARRDAGHAEAFPGSRRYRRRFASRLAAHRASASSGSSEVELAPFRAGIAAGAAAVMVAHVELPALDPARVPATLSRPIVTGLLRDELRFNGLVVTDSMAMDGVTKLGTAAENAVKAVLAGNDLLLDSRDTWASYRGIKAAVEAGTIPRARIEASVRRILTEKARLGLHKQRAVSLDDVPLTVGTRRHAAFARQVSERAVTLIKDERNSLPLKLPPTANVLFLSVLDYPRGWRIAAPSRTLLPALRARWANLQAIEVSDATTPNELALVRAMASRFDAIIAGIFVRASSGTGRLDLAAPVAGMLQDLARATARSNQPFVAAFFGSPYAAMAVPEIPTMLLTYDFSDDAELTAVRAMAGEIPISGKLPVALPGMFPLAHGLARTAATSSP